MSLLVSSVANGFPAPSRRSVQRFVTIIVIDCDDPEVGLVGCILVGMADVSSCVIDALPGQWVKKGDELGYFQYGGSTYRLVFCPNVVECFVPHTPNTLVTDCTDSVRINALR
jgi:hypothetical protein